MAKQIIRLTESDLHTIIRNTVKRVLKEGTWQDELGAMYDGAKGNPLSMDMDKHNEILKNAKRQYKTPEEYSAAVRKFFNDRESADDVEKAKRDPAFELWGDEYDRAFQDKGFPMAKDFEPMPFKRGDYEKRVKRGESPRALRTVPRSKVSSDDSQRMPSEDFEERMEKLRQSGAIK